MSTAKQIPFVFLRDPSTLYRPRLRIEIAGMLARALLETQSNPEDDLAAQSMLNGMKTKGAQLECGCRKEHGLTPIMTPTRDLMGLTLRSTGPAHANACAFRWLSLSTSDEAVQLSCPPVPGTTPRTRDTSSVHLTARI